MEEGDIDLKLGVDHPVKLCATAKEIVTDNTFAKYGEVQMKEEEELKHYFGSVQPDQFRFIGARINQYTFNFSFTLAWVLILSNGLLELQSALSSDISLQPCV